MNKKERMDAYEAPAVELAEVRIEKGFAYSIVDDPFGEDADVETPIM